MKRTLAVSMMLVCAALLFVGLGTFAYFSDSASSTGNTFTTGNIVLTLKDADEGFADPVTATWSSPVNWAPGQEVDATIRLRDDGSIAAHQVFANWTNLVDPGGLASKIQVTWIEDSTWVGANYVGAFVSKYDGDDGSVPDGKLSLAELVRGDSSGHNSAPGNDIRFYCTYNGADPAVDTTHNCLDPNGAYAWWTPGPSNPDYFWIRMKFKLMDDTGNTYQGKTASVDLNLTASQT